MSMEQLVLAGQRDDHIPAGVCQVYELGVLDRPPALSHRQLAIGELMATGAKDTAIARQLGVSVRTVRSEISALIAALGATSRFQAGCLLVRRFG
ncbi:helix-turn-helix transcriptional regulator [Kribbella sp. NPDC051718]|uniref:response regulator transcription factor n=1 Tax=Kribbella sp. NPDC051718 TaxID=3155168 RepID=UPI003445C90E